MPQTQIAKTDLEQMAVAPAERGLERQMQAFEGDIRRHLNFPHNLGFDIVKGDCETKNGCCAHRIIPYVVASLRPRRCRLARRCGSTNQLDRIRRILLADNVEQVAGKRLAKEVKAQATGPSLARPCGRAIAKGGMVAGGIRPSLILMAQASRHAGQ